MTGFRQEYSLITIFDRQFDGLTFDGQQCISQVLLSGNVIIDCQSFAMETAFHPQLDFFLLKLITAVPEMRLPS